MRSTVQKLIGTTAAAVLVAAFALATSAAALQPPPGEGQPESPGPCTFAVSSTEPGPVTASVVALPPIDEDYAVQLFHFSAASGTTAIQTVQVSPPPALPIVFATVQTGVGDTLSVNYILRGVSTYSTSCATVAGETVITVRGAAAARLAFTGSSDATSKVLVATAAIVLGTVLVVATRRRNRVNA